MDNLFKLILEWRKQIITLKKKILQMVNPNYWIDIEKTSRSEIYIYRTAYDDLADRLYLYVNSKMRSNKKSTNLYYRIFGFNILDQEEIIEESVYLYYEMLDFIVIWDVIFNNWHYYKIRNISGTKKFLDSIINQFPFEQYTKQYNSVNDLRFQLKIIYNTIKSLIRFLPSGKKYITLIEKKHWKLISKLDDYMLFNKSPKELIDHSKTMSKDIYFFEAYFDGMKDMRDTYEEIISDKVNQTLEKIIFYWNKINSLIIAIISKLSESEQSKEIKPSESNKSKPSEEMKISTHLKPGQVQRKTSRSCECYCGCENDYTLICMMCNSDLCDYCDDQHSKDGIRKCNKCLADMCLQVENCSKCLADVCDKTTCSSIIENNKYCNNCADVINFSLQIVDSVKKYGKINLNWSKPSIMISNLIEFFDILFGQFIEESNVVPTEYNENRTIICGDIHGCADNLIKIFRSFGYPNKNHTIKYIFLGDYVDRGKQGFTVLMLLFSLKILYDEDVILIRGNHERAGLNKKYGFYDELVNYMNMVNAKKYINRLFDKIQDVFDTLPLGVLLNNEIFISHGGIPRAKGGLITISQINNISRFEMATNIIDTEITSRSVLNENFEQLLLLDLLWSDINFIDIKDLKEGVEMESEYKTRRGIGHYFGLIELNNFLVFNKLSYFIRGHQVFSRGHLETDKVLTLTTAPCCDFGKVKYVSSFLVFESGKQTAHLFEINKNMQYKEVDLPNNFINSIIKKK